MDNWAGFTDADLKKIKGVNTNTDGRRPSSGGQRRSHQPKRPLAVKSIKHPPAAPLDDSMLLSKTVAKKTSESQPVQDKPVRASNTGTGNTTPQGTNTGSHGHSPEDSTSHLEDINPKQSSPAELITAEKEPADEEVDLVTDEQEIFKHEQKSLESFQKQHKMIEEQNKLKREKLAQAIKERAKKAKAESVKLVRLQNELSKLDQLLTVDVSIIRDKIEDASREFFEAQKRYDRAEKEFVNAKIDLHKKMEAKDSLTEHLYTVIYQNEMRKSKKLAELMNELEMEEAEDVDMSDMVNIAMPHPSLLSPVQLPVGRYGQIGPHNIHTPPSSPIQQQPTRTEMTESSSQEVNSPSSQRRKSEDVGNSDVNQLAETGASENAVQEDKKANAVTDKVVTDDSVLHSSSNNSTDKSQGVNDTETNTKNSDKTDSKS